MQLQELYCNVNKLTSLFIKSGTDETILYFFDNSYLNYVCADGSQVTTVDSACNLSDQTFELKPQGYLSQSDLRGAEL